MRTVRQRIARWYWSLDDVGIMLLVMSATTIALTTITVALKALG